MLFIINKFKRMLLKINLFRLDYFLNDVNGVLHVGANLGQERFVYEKKKLNVLWIEPIPDVFARLQENIQPYPKQSAYSALITDTDGTVHQFNIANNDGASSSIYNFGDLHSIYPEILYTGNIQLISKRLDTFIKENAVSLSDYDSLVLDTQGSELLIIKGAGDYLNKFKYIKLEVADFNAYDGAAGISEVDKELTNLNFTKYLVVKFASCKKFGSYYEVLYKNNIK